MKWPRHTVPVSRSLGAMLLVTVAYYMVPDRPLDDPALAIALFICSLLGLAWLIGFLIHRGAVAERAGETPPTGEGLLLAVYVSLMMFAETYYRMAQQPGWFWGLTSKTDALYFTVVTAATVGYGDVHAVAQEARIVVMLQVVFDLVFVAGAVSVVLSRFRRRAGESAGGDG